MKLASASIILGFALILTGCSGPTYTNSVTEVSVPAATNYVVDAGNVLKPETEAALNDALKAFDGKAQVAVLTIDSISPYSIEQYSMKVAEKWKVGYAGKDNGAIIVIAVRERKARIEVGYGLEGDLTDAQAGRILDERMIPALKVNDWDTAVLNGVEALKSSLAN